MEKMTRYEITSNLADSYRKQAENYRQMARLCDSLAEENEKEIFNMSAEEAAEFLEVEHVGID